jgi:hypothetical protein
MGFKNLSLPVNSESRRQSMRRWTWYNRFNKEPDAARLLKMAPRMILLNHPKGVFLRFIWESLILKMKMISKK